jgi:spermidine synthase
MMGFVREQQPSSGASFSFLYLANVVGAVLGALAGPFVLIELMGFRQTLWVAAAGNFVVAAASAWLAWNYRPGINPGALNPPPSGNDGAAKPVALPGAASGSRSLMLWVLFATGFCSMAMEVVWTRAFTPVVKTQVYSFALVVATYLAATAAGSFLYRRHLGRRTLYPANLLLALLFVTALLPVLVNDPRFVTANWLYQPDAFSVFLLLASITPFCGLLGYLTPRWIDEFSGGAPAAAGRAYALNVVGCILGPLVACYVLLPWLNERHSLLLLALPFLVLFVMACRSIDRPLVVRLGAATAAVLCTGLFFSQSYEDKVLRTEKHATVRRDYAASVLCYGEGFYRLVCVNGLGMTTLTPVTKFMVHLPLAHLQVPPQSALVICFGMGTSYRSALSWDINTTAVELVPSVKDSFGFFHSDAAQFANHPKGRIVVDDGHRFLKRTAETYDVIVVDPPPPLEAAGSSLLYSREFFSLARSRLTTNGILQAWYPGGDLTAARAIFRALHETFPHVRCFDSAEKYGAHLLASVQPLPVLTGEQAAARMPADAQRDLLEWNPGPTLPAYLNQVLTNEHPFEKLLDPDPRIIITDDKPFNEYFLLRRLREGKP